MRYYLRCILVLSAVLLLTGLSWSLTFGELDWDSIDQEIEKNYPQLPHLNVQELYERIATGKQVYLIDVREREEYQVSHIDGAVLSTLFQEDTIDKESTIVAYCSVGLRSARFVDQLRQNGFTRVYNLQGSLFMWANNDYPLVADGKSTKYVHPYNRRWGKLLRQDLHKYNTASQSDG